jgi:hypothetical protein
MKTAVQAYNEAQERRKDPAHMARLKRMQERVDSESAKLAEAVKTEMAFREHIKKHTNEMQQKQRRRRHAGLSRRKARPKARRR